jgi:hypothetical protein
MRLALFFDSSPFVMVGLSAALKLEAFHPFTHISLNNDDEAGTRSDTHAGAIFTSSNLL